MGAAPALMERIAVNGLRLLVGGGVEAPTASDLGAGAAFRRNEQISAGAVVSAGGRWRVGIEVTGYRTHTVATPTVPSRLLTSRQVELSTFYSF